MVDFKNLAALEVSANRTARYTLYQLEGEPVLIVAPATQANKPYFNRLLTRSQESARRIRAAGISAAMLEENRDGDRELYPKFIIVGWEGIVDANGNSVPFSLSAASDFLAALPNWLFDDLRTFCGESNNFLERGSKSSAEVEATAGN